MDVTQSLPPILLILLNLAAIAFAAIPRDPRLREVSSIFSHCKPMAIGSAWICDNFGTLICKHMIRYIICFSLIILCTLSTLSASTIEELLRKNTPLRIGLITAVPGERGHILEAMESPISIEKGGRTYYQGKLHGIETVLVASRIGKVAAAATTAHLILDYGVDLIIFVGVAGAVDTSLSIGDIIVANSLIQHDMDARPFCPMYEIPLLKIKECPTDKLLNHLAFQASQQFIDQEFMEVIPRSILNEFNITHPTAKTGLVITGDQVISQDSQKIKLKEQLPSALCVEMEGASVAQVCYEYGTPCVIIRTISDYANHVNTQVDVRKFVQQASGYYSTAIIRNMYSLISLKINELR